MLMGWANYLPELVGVVDKLKVDGHQIVFWERSQRAIEIDKSCFPGTIFRDHIYGGRNGVEEYKKIIDFEPLGDDVAAKFSDTEVIVLSTLERYYPEKTTQEKRQIYYDLLRYWLGMIKKLNPEVAIFEEVAHHPDTCIAYEVLKYFGIKTVIINFTNLKDRLILSLDNKYHCPELDLSLKNNSGRGLNLEDLSSEMREILEAGTCLKEAPIKTIKRFNEDKKKILYGFGPIVDRILLWLKMIISFRLGGIIYNFVKNRISGNARKEYLRIQKSPDFNAKYVYVALHYQPEANTNVLGGIFVNQINLLEIISAALPAGWSIYVKEHPVQFYSNGIGYNTFRYEGYYKRMAAVRGVRLMPIETNTYELLKHSQAVATVTGTAAWEAALRSKPALIFGYMWFQNCPGVFRIKNVAQCREFFDLIRSKDFKIKKDDLARYLFSVEEATVPGTIYTLSKSESSISEADNADNLYRAISRLLV